MDNYFNVSALRQAMLEQQMSEAKLARTVGVSRACINRILKKQRQPSSKVVRGLKLAFPEKSLDYFFECDDFNFSMELFYILQEKELMERIESLRNDLKRIVKSKGIHSSEALEISQNLDIAINNYYQLIMNKQLDQA